MLPIELLRFLALPAIERQIDARLQFVGGERPVRCFRLWHAQLCVWVAVSGSSMGFEHNTSECNT
jgi:hypothetical protein